MQKLKVGDSFIYTKKMNDLKINSKINDNDAKVLIGKTVFVVAMDGLDAYYIGPNQHEPKYIIFSNIVDNALEEKVLNGWTKEVKFVRGDVTITDKTIYIDGISYSHKDFTEKYNKYHQTYNKLRSIKKDGYL